MFNSRDFTAKINIPAPAYGAEQGMSLIHYTNVWSLTTWVPETSAWRARGYSFFSSPCLRSDINTNEHLLIFPLILVGLMMTNHVVF